MANAFGALFADLQADYSGNADDTNSVTLAVAPGYYYGIVEGTENAGIVYKPMLINAVPVVDSANNTYNKHADVNVDAKSEPVTIEKTEDLSADDDTQVKTTDNYSVGDTIHFTITTNMPNYPSNATKAKAVITDTPTGLDDDHTTVTVNVGGSDFTAGDDTFAVAEAGKGFTVTFAQAFILAHPGEAIIVEYDAVLEAVDNVTATSTNTATITYNTNPYVDSEVQPGDTDTQKNYGVYVFKYDSDTNEALAGAKFILVKANAAGTAPADPQVIVGAEATTDGDGHVSWEGLKAGTYFVIETAAPAGYRLDPTPHAVVLSETEATEDNPMTDPKAEEYYNDVEVPNTPDWDTYAIVKGKTGTLNEGEHVLKVLLTGAYANLDWLRFTDGTETLIAPLAAQKNPQYEKAIVYDMGGKLVGYANLHSSDDADWASQLSIQQFPANTYLVKTNGRSRVVVCK